MAATRRHRHRGCLIDHRPQSEPQLRCRQLLIVEKTAKICDHAPIAPELASLTGLGTVASTPPEIGDPVIDQLDTGIGQPQQLPTPASIEALRRMSSGHWPMIAAESIASPISGSSSG